MRPTRREVLRVAGAAAVLGMGSACARIPTDSPISSRPLSGQSQPGAPYVRALPPPPDATAQQLVSGFLQAGVGAEDDFAVARAYLTGEALSSWDPLAQTTIYSGRQELTVESAGDGRLALQLEVLAVVGDDGVRSLLTAPAQRTIEVAVTEVDGQRRLSEVPDGIFLSEAAFDSLYVPARLYFLDARRRHLVPDHRWFPLGGGPAAVLEALVRGPRTFLEGAVTTQVPESSRMADVTTSTGVDGAAQVTVPSAIMSLAPGPRALALSQVEASLRSVRTLSGVRLVDDGEPIVMDEGSRVERALPGHRPIAAGATGVIALSEKGAPAQPAQLVPAFAEMEIDAPAIAQNGVLAAALTPQGSSVLIASTDGSVEAREAATGGSFVAPRVDDAGFVWTSIRSNPGAVLALSARSPDLDAKVDAPWLAGREVRALDIAGDATRMIVLSAGAAGTSLDLCAVVRDGDGRPASLTEPVPVRTTLEDITQAVWYDEIAVLVLGVEPATGEPRAQILDFINGRESLPELRPGTDRVAGSAVAESVWAGTADAELLRSDGEGWTPVDIAGRDPAFY